MHCYTLEVSFFASTMQGPGRAAVAAANAASAASAASAAGAGANAGEVEGGAAAAGAAAGGGAGVMGSAVGAPGRDSLPYTQESYMELGRNVARTFLDYYAVQY